MLVLFVINAVSHRPTPKDRDSGTALQSIASPASDGLKQAMFSLRSNGLACGARKERHDGTTPREKTWKAQESAGHCTEAHDRRQGQQ